MQRVALINGKNKNKDHDLSKISEALMTAGVVEGLAVTSGSVSAGYAFVEVLRAGKKIRVMYESDAAVTIDTTGTKKVFISIDQVKVDDGSSNAVDGTGIGSIQTAASYPASNFVPLASITGGVITDERSFVKPTGIEDRGTLQKNSTVSTHTANYTLLSTETRNETFSMDATAGNRTFTLNPGLFPTTNGCFEFTFVKSDSSANTVTIDVGSGNTIDGSHTYVLTVQNESVTIQIQSSTFAKVIATANRPISVSVENFQKNITAGEDITAGRMLRMGKITNADQSNQNTILQNTEGGTSNLQYFSYENTSTYEVGQGITSGQTGFLSQISVWLNRVGGVMDMPFNCEVFSNAGFTTLIGTSTNSYNQNLLGTTSEKVSFNFIGVPVTNGTIFYVKLNKLTGTVNTTNYVKVNHSPTSAYAGGTGYQFSSAGVVTAYASNDLRFESITATAEDNTKVYQTNSSIEGKIDFIGTALATVVKNNSVSVGYKGIVPITGLTVGSEYFLNGTAGQIGTTAGTFEKLVGLAISTTSLFLYENKKLEKYAGSFLATRDIAVAGNTVTYTHNLGKKPKIITVATFFSDTILKSDGVWTELNGNMCNYCHSSFGGADNTNSIRMSDSGSAYTTGIIQNVTTTSFDVVYTKVASPTSRTFQMIFILQ